MRRFGGQGTGRHGLARLGGPPLIVQLIGLVVGVLVAAQLVTLLLTLILPPAPPRQYRLAAIAAALAGTGDDAGFDRAVMPGPPDFAAPGWFVSDQARGKLAALLHRPAGDVALGFFTQLPVGGSVQPAVPAPLPRDAERVPARRVAAVAQPIPLPTANVEIAFSGDAGARLMTAALIQQMPGGSPGGGFPGGRSPGGGFPGNGGYPGGGFPPSRSQGSRTQPQGAPPAYPTASPQTVPAGSPDRGASPGGGSSLPTRLPPGQYGPPRPAGLPDATRMPPRIPPSADQPLAEAPSPVPPDSEAPSPAEPIRAAPTPASERHAVAAPAEADRAPAPAPDIAPTRATPRLSTPPAGQPVAIAPSPAGLFGLAPAPFVEGDFVAGVRRADGRWTLVRPHAEGFPSAWQRRVALWFLLSLLAVAPVAWLFARRIVGPLDDFAQAAELLGRDPGAAVLPLDGPAEIGRAAHAFNQMQSRLRGFVDDRTAMIGAISHDLRTPLTRLRFRIEDVPDAQQAGLRDEVGEMEAMISSVIAFMRDAAVPNARERRDLAEIVDDVVEGATLLGDVRAERMESAIVDVDPLGIRRVLDNLLTNAIKYGGGAARVALRVEADRAVADIVDHGPGVPDGELERVFEPFYRSDAARRSGREGSGLGLAVCRSIARSHGGDVALFRAPGGFTARVTLPLAYADDRRVA